MDNVNSYLVDWSVRFLENKDAIRKEIVNIEKNGGGYDFAVYYKDKVKHFIATPTLEKDIFNKIKIEGYMKLSRLHFIPSGVSFSNRIKVLMP